MPSYLGLVAPVLWGSLVLTPLVNAQSSETIVRPTRYRTNAGFRDYTSHAQSSCFTLDQQSPLVTLDYGTEAAGFPFFDVDSITSAVQIEAKYSEPYTGLSEPFGDGPFDFANGLSNTFRVETFNVTSTGRVESPFIQGGQRWQYLKLLTNGTIRICGAGLRSLNDRTAVDQLPGYFESSNSLYNEIWALGARTVQQACIAAGAAPSTWEIAEDGVYLRGQQPAQSVKGASFDNYTLAFDTKIIRGGTGWKVVAGVAGYGAYFVLTSEYPQESTFVNVNKTVVPPNSLAVGYGWNLVNQISLTSGKVNYYPIPFDVKEDEWYRIFTFINATGYGVTVNETEIFVPLATLQTPTGSIGGSGSLTGGTWGFGPYQDQVALVKDVEVHAQNGTLLYHNSMTSDSVLEEYGVLPNTHSICLDGAKRDRLVWSGDFFPTHRIVQTSTGRDDFISGTLEYLIDRQATSSSVYDGLFSMSPQMGQSAKYTDVYSSFGLLDYQFFTLAAVAGYYKHSDDRAFIQKYWSQIERGVEAVVQLIDEQTGLAVTGNIGAFFTGSSNGTAPSALLAYTLAEMANLAAAVNATDSAKSWTHHAESIKEAVNQQLWNPQLGTYGVDINTLDEQAIAGSAWVILSGIANVTQTQSTIAALSSLRLGIGYKSSTSTANSSSTNLAPFLSGFLLEALFQASRDSAKASAERTTAISVLLDQLWAAMVTEDQYYTGTAWEYLYPDGRPGLDLYTSHAHPWGGAPTFVFSEYVLGVQPTSPGFATWTFQPAILDVNVSWARGRVPTPRGSIQASWRLSGSNKKSLQLQVCGPKQTKGVISLPFAVKSYTVDGKTEANKSQVEIAVSSGSCADVRVSLQ
ncbi:Six-hairpin glycosidase [Aspergillus homomorphus CBS 101889]|uniref:Six-hairpin glycosidase n=1 Tax=Aspergillus homomorphus (strain CBS 101889) TaxID=1450537 RepID=A0A395HRV6_ASPHC|nr:Six-hairpin glycosidase [Aspergillus homomorphus CBS 101889]RAL10672.1 Six-hairpin glycosidase [Aspergillus homomorphus CBS 101889]